LSSIRALQRGLAALLLVSACTMGPAAPADPLRSQTASGASTAQIPSFSRVAVIVMENREYGAVIGNPDAPYVNGLAKRYALATRSYAIRHPSLPNYLALIGGSTFGIDSDCTDCNVSATNLVDQLEANDISWKAYMQGMPRPCYSGAVKGRYAKKHNPFLYFDDIRQDGPRCHRVVPFRVYVDDLDKGNLPRFVWITPDLCHDGHDCGIQTADLFLKNHVPALLDALGDNGVLFLTWDEGYSSDGCCEQAAGGHIVTVVAGPAARSHVKSSARVDHYSLLRTIEEAWGFKRLRGAACDCSRLMSSLLRKP
jgi:hypothetical protein